MEPWQVFYNGILSASWPLLWLFYRVEGKMAGKYAASSAHRLGLRLPDPLQGGARPVWIHALSVGETLSTLPVVHRIKALRPDVPLCVSTATDKGYRVARNQLGHLTEAVFFLPHDHLWNMTRLVARLHPAVFVLVETDLWPNLLWVLKKKKVPAIMVNARLSPRSFSRYARLASLARRLLDPLDRIYVQSRDDAHRFARLGVSPQRLRVAGNLKFDLAVYQKETFATRRDGLRLILAPGRPVWIAGSTHDGEERLVLEAHQGILRQHPNALLILAPRHIERTPAIAALCTQRSLRWERRSRNRPVGDAHVFLLDSIGELASLYPMARGAFIGGSLVPRGGHNPLEAAVHGVPCCWGPHLYNFREIEAFLVKEGCGRPVGDGDSLRSFILETMEESLWDRPRRIACAERVCAQAGAASLLARDITALLA
ncbi:3-deoxy-D-manno-octulosonic acid transferase [Desulfosoma sp.]